VSINNPMLFRTLAFRSTSNRFHHAMQTSPISLTRRLAWCCLSHVELRGKVYGGRHCLATHTQIVSMQRSTLIHSKSHGMLIVTPTPTPTPTHSHTLTLSHSTDSTASPFSYLFNVTPAHPPARAARRCAASGQARDPSAPAARDEARPECVPTECRGQARAPGLARCDSSRKLLRPKVSDPPTHACTLTTLL
jgi:hypothetical protein